jgi:hypothetical protein
VISAVYISAIVAWAKGNDERIAQLTAERDALITGQLSGGKPGRFMASGGSNGKNFSFLQNLSREDKLAVLHRCLQILCVIPQDDPTIVHGNFQRVRR